MEHDDLGPLPKVTSRDRQLQDRRIELRELVIGWMQSGMLLTDCVRVLSEEISSLVRTLARSRSEEDGS